MRLQNGARHHNVEHAATAWRQGSAHGSGGGGGAASRGGSSLPLLPLFDHVLLPGGFLRVTIPVDWRKSGALVEQLLQQQGPGELLVAAVPYLAAGASAGASDGGAPASAPEDGEESGDASLDLERLHHTGTAARVLQLVRRTALGGWTVTLEGRCRLRVRGVHLASRPPSRELYEASVEQLDYFAPGGGPGRGAALAIGAASGGAGAAAGGREQEELARELLKVGAMACVVGCCASVPVAVAVLFQQPACWSMPAWLVASTPALLLALHGVFVPPASPWFPPASLASSCPTKQPTSVSPCPSLCPQGTRRLFLLIQGEADGREAAARVARALAQQGPARMSDVLGSLVARSLHARLALLDTLDVTTRLKVGLGWAGLGWGGWAGPGQEFGQSACS